MAFVLARPRMLTYVPVRSTPAAPAPVRVAVTPPPPVSAAVFKTASDVRAVQAPPPPPPVVDSPAPAPTKAAGTCDTCKVAGGTSAPPPAVTADRAATTTATVTQASLAGAFGGLEIPADKRKLVWAGLVLVFVAVVVAKWGEW